MNLLLTYLFLSLFVSFVCSLFEAVILTMSPGYINAQINKGKKWAFLMKKLKEGIDRPIAAILTLNTVAHTVGAAGVGSQVLKLYGDSYVAAASGAMTFVILVFSEIIPKTLGASNWKKFGPVTAYSIQFMIWSIFPVVFILEKISEMVGSPNKIHLTREEMIATAEIGVGQGALKKKESQIIRNLLMLDNIFVYDIMTPRSVLMALPEEMTIQEVMALHKPIRYSRIPVYRENLDNVLGVVHRYQILEAASNDQDNIKLGELMTNLHSVPEDISVSACLDQLIHRNDHIFLAVDDYGSTMGLVTLEDAIETLLGVEIVDEFDSVADLRAYALDQWKKRKSTRASSSKVAP